MQAIRDDFDNLARVRPLAWDTNGHYHDFLLRQLPFHLGNTLDIGCGTGAFARLLAARSDHVLALDFSPEMIRVAREQSH